MITIWDEERVRVVADLQIEQQEDQAEADQLEEPAIAVILIIQWI